MAQKKTISYVSYMRNKRELDALYALGYRYDMEKDPEKKASLEKEIIKRCDKLKPKLGLKDISDEEARTMMGLSSGGGETAKNEIGEEHKDEAVPSPENSSVN